jgi:FkbM family methyltransferase
MLKLKECRYGRMMYLDNDTYIGRSLDEYGESHFHEVQLLKQVVSKGDTVIDVGANMGVVTVPLAQAVGPKGYVVSIEAQPFLFNVLCGNLALNELHQVQPSNRIASHNSGSVAYMPEVDYKTDLSFGSLFASPQATGQCRPISTVSIDDMGLTPRLIKIDVEGMEYPVLYGAKKTIERCKPILFVELLDDYERIIEFIKSVGYDFKLHEPPLFNENNFAHNDKNVFINDRGDPIVSIDIICWHKDTPLNVGGPFLYDLANSPFERHDPLKGLKEKFYGIQSS